MNRLPACVAALAAVLSLSAASYAGPILYVDDDAPPGGDGATWQTAFRFLQDALAVAIDPGNGITEIRVAQGTYTPDQDEAGNVVPGDRTATFHLVYGVALLGGYAGINQADPDARDIELYETVLSGDLAGDDGPAFANTAENAYHVTTAAYGSPDIVLDGFTVTAGNADAFPEHYSGAAIRVSGTGATVSNCTFNANQAHFGAAVGKTTGGHIVLTDCTFDGNVAEDSGGAVMSTSHSSATITRCVFTNNACAASTSGGALYATGSVTLLTDCTFVDNSGGAGGAAWVDGDEYTITGCTFTGNTAVYYAGALWVSSGSESLIADCTFADNASENWGGALLISDNGDVSSCTFTGNSAEFGGALYHAWGDLTVTDSSFAGNTASLGGAFCVHDPPLAAPGTFVNVTFESNTAIFGGAIYLDDCDHTLAGCTLRLNEAVLGGGVYCDAGCAGLEGTLIESNHATFEGGGLYNEGGQFALSGCAIRSNTAGTDGAGLYTIAGLAEFVECAFTDNLAWETGGGIHARESTLELTACTFDANDADWTGGALFQYAVDEAAITDCVFSHNHGNDAGAIFNDASHPTLSGCTFIENASTMLGGAICNVNGSHPEIDHCAFMANGSPFSQVFGGAIANIDSDPFVSNCLFVANAASSAGGLYNERSSPTVTNCTFVRNEGRCVENNPGSPIFANCIFWYEWLTPIGGTPAVVTSSIVEGGYPGEGNLDVDPMFVDPNGPDDSPYHWQDNDYRLAAGSPAIDAGDNTAVPMGTTADLDGNPRFHDDPTTPDTGVPDGVNPIVDMGAYEFQGTSCAWDVDGSGDVGVGDFLALLAAWGSDPGGPPDFNGDGDVNYADLLELLANWGPCP